LLLNTVYCLINALTCFSLNCWPASGST